MSYLLWLSVAFTLFLGLLSSETPRIRCPQNCNCIGTSTVICSSVVKDSFEDKIAVFKIVNPSEPLVLSKRIFYEMGLNTVDFIQIENATISEMSEDAFEELTTLTAISIVNSDINDFPSNIISKVNTLKSLNLMGSKLRKFSTLYSEDLKELDMSNCKLSEISENMFNHLPELRYLNLENNEISKVHPLAFINLTNLEELIFTKNKLTHLMPNLLENNMELVTLDLSFNPIGQFNLNIVSFLEKLVLKGCSLKSFNATIGKNFDELPFLVLSDNEIEEISPKAFEQMVSLEYINLSNNKLRNLDANVFENNGKLKKIILDNNYIQKLPKFTNKHAFFETRSFSCNKCNITEINPDTFENMRGLTSLSLSNNRLKEISPDVFENMPSLQDIDISYNDIGEFKVNTFAKLSQLERLNISGNPLKQPLDANMFYQNRVLRTLDASFCHLKQLWSENAVLYSSVPSIRDLLISDNSFRSLSPIELQVVSNLEVLDIRNNPIECLPVLRDTITWLTERGVYPAQLKTHESFSEDDAVFEETGNKLLSWKKLAKDACEDEDYFDNYDNDEIEVNTQEISHTAEPKNSIKSNGISDEYEEDSDDDDDDSDDYYIDYDQKSSERNTIDDDKLFEQVKTEIDLEKLAIDSIRFKEKRPDDDSYSYLSPTLVFILTAASVLVVAANVMLLILRSKGALITSKDGNLPHFKILQWGTVNKLKKHSGSVYQQLSEEKSVPTTPKVNRYQKLPTVHISIP